MGNWSLNDETTTFGLHMMLEGYGVDAEKLDDMRSVFKFLDELPGLIGMNKLTAPTVICADANASGKDPGGITGFVLISESHISIHTFADRGFFTMDVYSCRDFEDQIPTVLRYVKSVFPYENYEIHTVKRGLAYPTAAIEKNSRLVSLTSASTK